MYLFVFYTNRVILASFNRKQQSCSYISLVIFGEIQVRYYYILIRS